MTATSLSVAYSDFGEKTAPPKDMFAAIRNGQIPNQYSPQIQQQQMNVQPSYAKQVQAAQQQLAFQMANQNQAAKQLMDSQAASAEAQALTAQLQAQWNAQAKMAQQYGQIKPQQQQQQQHNGGGPITTMNPQHPIASDAPWNPGMYDPETIHKSVQKASSYLNDSMDKLLRWEYVIVLLGVCLLLITIFMYRRLKTCHEQIQSVTDRLRELAQTFSGSSQVVNAIADKFPRLVTNPFGT